MTTWRSEPRISSAVLRTKLVERADLDDRAVLLVDGGVVQDEGAVTAGDFAEDVLAADERRGHTESPAQGWNRAPIIA